MVKQPRNPESSIQTRYKSHYMVFIHPLTQHRQVEQLESSPWSPFERSYLLYCIASIVLFFKLGFVNHCNHPSSVAERARLRA